MSFENFNSYYEKIYGPRWPALLQSLKLKESQIARKNQFLSEVSASLPPHPVLSGCFEWGGGEVPRSPMTETLLEYYIMDPASVIVARALEVQSGDRVLDMCAAPGGKALILAESLKEDGELIANELSASRKDRLKKVIQQYIPRKVRDRIWVNGQDAGLYAVHSREKFDRILLDAPCSGERHLLQNDTAMKDWKENRSAKLAQRQYALLTAALEAAKPGARIVYSTCSISPLENDGVVERVLVKKKDRLRRIAFEAEVTGERTSMGCQYFPDQFGFGPIYFSVLEKA